MVTSKSPCWEQTCWGSQGDWGQGGTGQVARLHNASITRPEFLQDALFWTDIRPAHWPQGWWWWENRPPSASHRAGTTPWYPPSLLWHPPINPPALPHPQNRWKLGPSPVGQAGLSPDRGITKAIPASCGPANSKDLPPASPGPYQAPQGCLLHSVRRSTLS